MKFQFGVPSFVRFGALHKVLKRRKVISFLSLVRSVGLN